ncbi:hypothetical protein EON83_11250 [bacterium]|nr:MAG: hypothetical protein EON83_11250 [bacterium]
MPKAKKTGEAGTGKVGRPPQGAEPRVKRYFNFQESLNKKLDEEQKRTKASMNAITEAALKVLIAPELLTKDDKEFLKKFAASPIEASEEGDLSRIVEEAVARVMDSRLIGTSFSAPNVTVATVALSEIVVELPERQKEAIEEMAAGLGFGEAAHLLRSLIIGALSNPEGADNFLFAGQRTEAKLRTQRQLQQEEERETAPQLKVA